MSSLSSRRQGTPGALDLSKRMSASSLKGPFSPPLKSAQRTDLDGNLALEIARQEFEKRERSKRERRRLAALESGREIPLDSTGAEIRRIATPTTATFSPRHVVYASPPSASYNGGFREDLEEERKQREALEDEKALIESVKALSMGVDPEPPQQSRGRQSYYPRSSDRDSVSAYDFDGFPEPLSERDAARREEPSVGRWVGSYPTVPRRQHSPTRLTSPPIILHHHRDPTPPRPPKHAYPESTVVYLDAPAPPALPPKVPDLPPRMHSHSPSPDTPIAKQFSTPATLENGTPLRTMFLPASLRSTFLQIAHPNTSANLETCGILCGTLIQNALFVSRLVIPEQEATSDTCATKDEEGLFEYCDKEDLMVFGWIHTHPTQTCFMSSVDLHTHSGYQMMMRESIAIVCAPSKRPS
jgi:STAM-binding protein